MYKFKICLICKKEFTPTSGSQHGCSITCLEILRKNYSKKYYLRNKQKIKVQAKKSRIKCKICNKKISRRSEVCRSCSLKLQYRDGRRTGSGINHSKCIDCGKELTSYRKNSRCKECYIKFNVGDNNSLWHPDLFCMDCGEKIYKYKNGIRCCKCNNKFHSGDNNGRWIDGRSYLAYPGEFNKFRKIIRERDLYTCQICGLTEVEYRKKSKRALDIHHKDHNKENNDLDNLITVCRKCHRNL